MKAVLLGGTRGIGRALARRMVGEGDRLFLLGREEAELDRSAADLAGLGEGFAGRACCDLARPAGFEPALDRADEVLEGFDTVVLTAADFGTQERLEADAELRARVLDVNFARTIEFCEAARRRLLARGGGTLCAFSSVAGDRPRSTVVLYGATKAGLDFYLRGLDLRYRRQGLVTVCVKPGFVHTGMTAGLKPPPFAAEPDRVAAVALRAIRRGRREVYAPPVWRWVMRVVRAIPTPLMRRVRF
jgi:short-subunit dehydrogenase